jgi:hypothetical protein
MSYRLFHLFGRLRAAFLLRSFDRAARAANATNAAALARILRANRGSEFGRRHAFATLAGDPGAFRRLPLERWTDVAPDVERMAAGEPRVRVTEPVLFFALSSGTTGASKRVPSTPSSFAWQRRFYTGINPAVPASRLPGGFDPYPGISLLSAAGTTTRTSGGIPVGLASANGLARVRRIAPYLWTSPWAAFELADPEESWYAHALFGLGAPTAKFLNAVFAPHLVAWLRFVESRWEDLLRDIHDGTVSRAALRPLLRPDRERAAALAGGLDVRQAWPWMRYVSTVITGPFAAALPALRGYLGDLPIHTTVWSASEGMIGLNLDLDRPERYVLCAGCAHFELVPAEHAREDQPETCDIADAEVGRCYEIVLTNDAGLYRYRLGDIAEVVDRYGEAPVFEFRYRLGSTLDLVGEKTSGDQAMSAVRSALGDAPWTDYAAWPDGTADPPHYILYIETDAPLDAAAFDAALRDANPSYASYRGRRLGPPVVRRLPAGTFASLARLRLERAPDVGHNQLKTPHLIRDPEVRAFLEGRAC